MINKVKYFVDDWMFQYIYGASEKMSVIEKKPTK